MDITDMRRSLNHVSSFLETCSTPNSDISEVALVSEDSWTESNSYALDEPCISDTQPQEERGTYSVTTESPRRTKRGHSPSPGFPPTFNYHVSTELTN